MYHKPDLVCIVESWLSPDISNNEIFLYNYQIQRLDRNRHGGGILIFIHCSLSFKVQLQGGPHNLEFLALSVAPNGINFTTCICLFYRPPSSLASIFDDLCTTIYLANPCRFSTFILLGDFNVNFFNPGSSLFLYLNDILSIFSLQQVVSSFTHISPNGPNSLIDLVLLSDPLYLHNCVTLPPLASSDHLGILLTMKLCCPVHPIKNPPRSVWIYNEADFGRACELIDEFNWDSVLSDNVDFSTSLWSQSFLEIMKICVPQRSLKLRKSLPWISSDIVSLIKERNFHFLKAKRFNDPTHFALYKSLRNQIVGILRVAKKEFFNSLAPSNSKQFWKTIKMINKEQSQIPSLSYNNLEAVTPKEKADMLNSFFSMCWNYSVAPLHDNAESSRDFSTACPDCLLCTIDEVLSLIRGLDVSKANGPDGISAHMLKSTALSIAPSLCDLFNISISNGHFPETWKRANIVPIFKSQSDKASPSGYRPISLLPIISKLLEKHVYSIISDHLADNHPISDSQWGFRKGMSTITAVLSLTHEWLLQLDHSQEICCIFFDFKKAFDSIPHALLMAKLEHLHLSPFILSWLDSYLTKRQQRVVINGVTSESITVVSGVPQGSVLGPLLFLIYIDSISQIQLSINSKLVMYADDILLYKSITATDDFSCLQNDVSHIQSWSSFNALTFNSSKCKQMLLSRKRKPTVCIPMVLNGQPLQIVNSYKYLGIIISSDLRWSTHIQYICNKAKKMLGILYRQFSVNSTETTMVKLYLTQVRPLLEYGVEVWHPYLSKDIQALENVQKFALRICSNKWQAHYNDLLEYFKLPSLENRRLYLSLCTFFKITHKTSYFPAPLLPSHLSSSALRSSNPNDFSVPFSHTFQSTNSFMFRSIRLWNNLPSEAKLCSDLKLFKKLISPLFS